MPKSRGKRGSQNKQAKDKLAAERAITVEAVRAAGAIESTGNLQLLRLTRRRLHGSLWDWPAHKVKIPKKSQNTPKWCVWAWCAVGFGWESPELRFGRRRASRLTRLVPLQEDNLQGLSAQE